MTTYAWSGIVWNDGRRLAVNFAFSDWAVLDIDDELHEYALEQAVADYVDTIHVIGVTRNHRKEKHGAICDRYRIAVPWAQRITDAQTYEGNMRRLKRKISSVDGSTLSAAQHFFPCSHIISIQSEGFSESVTADKYAADDIPSGEYGDLLASKQTDFMVFQRLPAWVETYLETGKSTPGERHRRGLGVATEMFELGIAPDLIFDKISNAPISRKWAPGEVRGLVRWAVQQVEGKLRCGDKEKAESNHLQRAGGYHQRPE